MNHDRSFYQQICIKLCVRTGLHSGLEILTTCEVKHNEESRHLISKARE